ncbi:MAG: glutathione S-transferase C-terminal domain-containing protein, partial [Lysobacterales bacterium]
FNPDRYTTAEDAESIAAVKAAAVNRIHRVAVMVEKKIGTTNHILFDRRTLLDAYAFSMLRWIDYLAGSFDCYPNMRRFMARMKEDPGVQKALIRESA